MRRIVTAGFVVFAMLGGTSFAQDAAKVQKGMQVYTAQKCSKCHSIAGKGNAKGKMDGLAKEMTPAEMREWIVDPVGMAAKNKKDRKPPMKKVAMSNDDVDALVAYLSTLK
jgi:mono/diheme cytochrome c family protein